ncbi:hypothetical protein L7F22_006085 [Adiantum nelumboides]|nr:hypothetical protein [Adiantum nelumboides]
MAGSLEKEDYYIRKFDGTNFTIWKQRMMDVLVNKGLAAPLKDRKEGVYNDDQWEELDARAIATICLHFGESIFFTIMDKTTAFELWDSLCSVWDGKSASNKVFLMKKLTRLSMKEVSSVSSHLNEFNALYLQLTSKGLNFDDEMKAIFLLCSLPASWDTFNTAISNSTHGGKFAFGDVTCALLTEEIQRQSLDSGGHGDVLKTSSQARANAKVKDKGIKEGDMVLRYNSKLDRTFQKKFQIKWQGPFLVLDMFSNGTYQLADLNGTPHKARVNGYRLKKYYARLMVVIEDELSFEESADMVADHEEKMKTSSFGLQALFATTADHE